MYIKPIPRNLLIHTATLKHKLAGDAWGEGAENEQVLNYVRMEPKKTLEYSKENQTLNLNSLLFIDAVNSTQPVEISVDDVIEWGGEIFTIKSIDKQYALDGTTLHHYEIGLI